MKASAIHDASHLVYNPTDDYQTKCYQLSRIASTNALSYILDPANQQTYKAAILRAFTLWDDLYPDLYRGGADDFTHSVPPATAFFNSVLALDIVHDGLSPSELSTAEVRLSKVAEWYWIHNQSYMSVWVARGMWSLYKDEARSVTARDKYKQMLMNYITPDGVFTSGPGYAVSKFADINKEDDVQHFMDVLEFTGNGAYYTDPKLRNLEEWLFGYSATPFGRNYIFGDSAPVMSSIRRSTASYRAYRFSNQAASYAAWDVKGGVPQGMLLPYVLMRRSIPAPERAVSRIFRDGGAWFMENTQSPGGLAAVLWNPRSIGDNHAHKEVNALNLCGYSEYLLRNSGYTGWRKGALDFSWDYINNRAVSGNTVLINYSVVDEFNPPLVNDHVSKAGAGITEGFLSSGFDYASGDSGSALPNGKHYRNLVFVPPQDHTNGYWVVFDEIKANRQGDTAHIALHPGSAVYATVSSNQEYLWTINRYSGHDVYLTIFEGTRPVRSEIKNGVLAAAWGDSSFVGKYLYSTYETNNSGIRNIVTVFFPHDATHPKAGMTRIVGDGYSGANIVFSGNVADVAIESSAGSTVTHDGVSFKASAILYRLQRGSMTFYFIRHGTEFDGGKTMLSGFTADKEVTLFIKDGEGKISSSGAVVTFRYPGLTGVLVDGVAAPLLAKGDGWVKVAVTAGTSDLKFVVTPR